MSGSHGRLAGGIWLGFVIGIVAVLGLSGPALGQASLGGSGGMWVCPPCPIDCHDKTYAEPGKCEHPDCRMDLIDRTAVRYVAIFIWQGAEVLDFAGPAEVFASARKDGEKPFEVYTVGVTQDPVTSQGFIKVTPEFSIKNCPQPDIFVLPGGGTSRVMTNPSMIDWVRRTSEHSEIAMSVCTGAMVLANAGLLDGKEATTFHGAIDRLRAVAPSTVVHDDVRFVDNGGVITSAGVSAGIDASLYVVSRLCGMEAAQETADYMEYAWRPDEVTGRVTSSGAPGELTAKQEFLAMLVARGVDAALAAREEMLAGNAASGVPGENEVNALGYRYLADADLSTAIEVFSFNARVYPDSFNVHDSLGEAYVAAGEREKAMTSYSRSLELNSENENARERLVELRGQ